MKRQTLRKLMVLRRRVLPSLSRSASSAASSGRSLIKRSSPPRAVDSLPPALRRGARPKLTLSAETGRPSSSPLTFIRARSPRRGVSAIPFRPKDALTRFSLSKGPISAIVARAARCS